jgi:hypothetical protein
MLTLDKYALNERVLFFALFVSDVSVLSVTSVAKQLSSSLLLLTDRPRRDD